eukprot:281761-Pyramimonas_sp.AAC.2
MTGGGSAGDPSGGAGVFASAEDAQLWVDPPPGHRPRGPHRGGLCGLPRAGGRGGRPSAAAGGDAREDGRPAHVQRRRDARRHGGA